MLICTSIHHKHMFNEKRASFKATNYSRQPRYILLLQMDPPLIEGFDWPQFYCHLLPLLFLKVLLLCSNREQDLWWQGYYGKHILRSQKYDCTHIWQKIDVRESCSLASKHQRKVKINWKADQFALPWRLGLKTLQIGSRETMHDDQLKGFWIRMLETLIWILLQQINGVQKLGQELHLGSWSFWKKLHSEGKFPCPSILCPCVSWKGKKTDHESNVFSICCHHQNSQRSF